MALAPSISRPTRDPIVLGVVVGIAATVATVWAVAATLRGPQIEPASALREE
jgi:hypothetical protein